MNALAQLVEATRIAPLAALRQVEPAACAQRIAGLCADPAAFARGALALHLRLVSAACGDGIAQTAEQTAERMADRAGGGTPWVWSAGDAHVGNFATLAVGPRGRLGTSPVIYELAAGDEEHPAPWHWDLLRLGASLGVALPLSSSAHRQQLLSLVGVAVERYAAVMAQIARGEAEHALRVYLQDCPRPLAQLIEREAEPERLADFRSRLITGSGARARLRLGAALTHDPEQLTGIAPALTAALAARGLEISVLDCAHCVEPTVESASTLTHRAPPWERRAPARLEGIQPSPHVLNHTETLVGRRWLALVRIGGSGRDRSARLGHGNAVSSADLRLLTCHERHPSALAAVIPAHPLPTGVSPSPITVALGGDPCHVLLPAHPRPILARTLCHARSVIDFADCDAGDLRDLARLWATLLAGFHVRGWQALGLDAQSQAAAVADAAGSAHQLPGIAAAIADDLRQAHELFRAQCTALG